MSIIPDTELISLFGRNDKGLAEMWSCSMKKRRIEDMEGSTPEENWARIGIKIGESVDFRDLKTLQENYFCSVILYFEEDLARDSTYAQDQKKNLHIPEFERPFVSLPAFIRFVSQFDPEFTRKLNEFPLMVEIVAIETYQSREGEKPVPLIKGLMPFHDELDNLPEG